MMFVDVLESVQRTGINGLSYRVLRWSFRTRVINMDKLWPFAYFVCTMCLTRRFCNSDKQQSLPTTKCQVLGMTIAR